MPGADEEHAKLVGAVVLAAGQSRRMGTSKLILPWGNRTMIEQVVQTLLDSGIREIVVVTGGDGAAIEAVLRDYSVRLVQNAAYAHSEMVASLQIGIESLTAECRAALIVLGDQPTIEGQVVLDVVETYLRTGSAITIPSFHMHRGHPWLVGRNLWYDITGLKKNQTMRDFLHAHTDQITYVPVETPGILSDIDTPEDYQRLHPSS